MPEERWVWLAAAEIIELFGRPRAERVIAKAVAEGRVRQSLRTGESQLMVCLP